MPSGVIEIRLRESLRLKTRDERMMEAALGHELPPTIIPARTTLRIVDFFEAGALALTPDGRRLLVSPETCRRSAYIPRAKPEA